MNHIFDMKINPYVGNAEVFLDGQSISAQSQLRICATENFFNWYVNAPSLLYAEVNDKYELRVQGNDIQYCLLRTIFAYSKECINIKYIPFKSRYSIQQRIEWMCDVSKELGIQTPQIPRYSLTMKSDIVSPFYKQYCVSSGGALTIYVVYEECEIESCLSQGVDKDDLIILIDECNKVCEAKIRNCPVIKTNIHSLKAVIEQWLDLMIFTPFLAYGYKVLTQSGKKGSFSCEAKKLMLIREDPVIRSNIVNKVEVGHSIRISIDEFPQTSLSLRISNTSVLKQQGDFLIAICPGKTRVDIISERGTVLSSQNINVYHINRVTDINLTVPGGPNVLLGDTIKITVDWKPTNAENLNNAVWSCDTNGVLKNIGSGTFKAEKDGKCTITLAIENVKKSVVITVMKKPTDIQMPNEVKVKLNKTTALFSASLIPVGSACKSMDVRVGNSQIARWNQKKKEISPVSEGTTELIVSGYDSKGQIVVQKKCKVIVLPEKDVITPPTVPTLMVVCIVLAVLTTGSELFMPCVIIGMILSCVEIGMNSIPLVKHMGGSMNKGRIALGGVGIIILSILLAWYMNLF